MAPPAAQATAHTPNDLLSESRMRVVGEVVGLLAVVGSLISVGLEIRQNAEATRAAAVAEVTGTWSGFHLELGADAAVQAAVHRAAGLEDYSEADPVGVAVAVSFTSAMFTNRANAHYHYESGLLEREFWVANRTGLEKTITGTGDFPHSFDGVGLEPSLHIRPHSWKLSTRS